MITSSHRIRAEEKKLYRKLVSTIFILILTFILIIYAGLPLLAKIIVTFSSLRGEKSANITSSTSLLFPPILESTYEATNSGRMTVLGFAEREATVKIFVNEREIAKVLTDNEGKFKATNITLTEGTNLITAQTIKDGFESSLSGALSIIYKKNPAKLDIEAPLDGQKFSGSNQEITISGETEPGSRVTINDRLVIVNPEGIFNYPVKLNEGENVFKITAIDSAGNQTTLERKVNFNP